MGISVDQYAILHHILENPGKLTSATVADSRGISRAAVSRGISQLIRRGYVLQSYQSSDRPSTAVVTNNEWWRAGDDVPWSAG